eukprot:scaffold216_cov375-Pavlova_lutheri.AAC.11
MSIPSRLHSLEPRERRRRRNQMIVRLGCPCGCCPEWTILELQGHVEMSSEAQVETQLALGRMCVSQTEGKLSLFIGVHQLEGIKEKLNKPFVIIEPRLSSDGNKQYEVVAVIRERLIFDAWPKPLVERPVFKRTRVS